MRQHFKELFDCQKRQGKSWQKISKIKGLTYQDLQIPDTPDLFKIALILGYLQICTQLKITGNVCICFNHF